MNDNIKMVCFDLDQTLIVENSWRELNMALGITPDHDAVMRADYLAGKISYEHWNGMVIEFFMKHADGTREGMTKILSKYTLAPGARESVEYLKAKGYKLSLISGSNDILVAMVAKDLGIEFAKSNNTFVFDEAGRLKSCHTYGADIHTKLEHLEVFCETIGISIKECACIGDGENDLEMFNKSEKGITFKGSPIEKDAWKVIETLNNIKDIL